MADFAPTRCFKPGDFEPSAHFYPRALNAQIHPLVRFFMGLSSDRLVRRYCHLKPRTDAETLTRLLSTPTRFLRWAGGDLMHVTDESGRREMVVIETNSCPSGQKSMPLLSEDDEYGGYRTLIEQAFIPLLQRRRLPEGDLAVIYDKNPMEATGYAATIAEISGEPTWCVRFDADDADPPVKFEGGVMYARVQTGEWRPIRAALRYVTQRPWSRIPGSTRTAILNPVGVCLAGGRNKAMAAKAYEMFNAEHAGTGLSIRTPETIRNASLDEVPMWVQSMGGLAVVKVPYSNAGQGVYTITSQAELDAFMDQEHRYDRFIVQSLIGNATWSSRTRRGRFYHVGTIPDRRGQLFVSDVRMMVAAGPKGFVPTAIYARRAHVAMTEALEDSRASWDMLGTNLSVKRTDGTWDTETNRLMLMDSRDFNRLGLGIDEIIEGYVQTVLSTIAIDRMMQRLANNKGKFSLRLFRSMTDDKKLISEIIRPAPREPSVIEPPA